MSAILDTNTFDAPMGDYGSDDVPMNQANSDPWIQGDGTMDDDSFILNYDRTDQNLTLSMDSIPFEPTMSMPSFSALSTPKPSMGELNAVEVEMQEVEEHHEYEMADDEHTDEIQDVEVTDAHNPGPDDFSAPQITFSESTETSASIHEITSMVAPQSGEIGHHSPTLPHDQPVVLEAAVEPAPEIPLAIEAISAPLQPEPVLEVSEVVPVEAGEQPLEQVESGLHHFPEEASEHTLPVEEGAVQQKLQHAEQKWQESASRSPAATADSLPPPQPSLVDHAQSSTPAPEQEDEAPAIEVPPADGSIDYHEPTAAPAIDPHEVYEGVCIEPPPAIPLEVAFSELSFALFNRKTTSGRSTPSEEDLASTSQVTVLLQEQPTLFYDPMNSVWKALRKEVALYIETDLEPLELMLAVPSLGLVLSEDNMYCQELCLHDLYALNEAYDEKTPLRLQLQTQERFFVRYAALQAGLNHGEDGEHHEEAEGGVYQDELDTHGQIDDLSKEQEQYIEQEDQVEHESNDRPLDDSNEQSAEATHAEETTEPEPGNDGGEHAIEAAYKDAENVGEQHTDNAETFQEPEGQGLPLSMPVVAETVADDDETEPSPTEVEDPSNNDGDSAEYEDYGEYNEEEYYEEDYEAGSTSESPNKHDQELSPEHYDAETETLAPPTHEETPAVESVGHDDERSEQTENADAAGIDTHLEEAVEDAGSNPSPSDDPRGLDRATTGPEQVDNVEYAEPSEEYPDFTGLPELPEDDGNWDDELDGEGEDDLGLEEEEGEREEQEESTSNDSSVTLSSTKGSTKRGYSEIDGDEEEEEDFLSNSIPTPEKRTRLV